MLVGDHVFGEEQYPEYAEQVAAQVCILAVRKTNQWLEKGIKATVGKMLVYRKSKSEFNKERKRDFRTARVKDKPPTMQASSSSGSARRLYPEVRTDLTSDISPRVEFKPVPYVSVLIEQLRSNCSLLTVLDLRSQNIGDEGVYQLSLGIRSQFRTLVLSDNGISDEGAAHVATLMRGTSAGALEELHLNNNRIAHGVQLLCDAYPFTPNLTLLNLSVNKLSTASFLSLGRLLQTRNSGGNLNTLFIGGNPNMDTSLKVFLGCLFNCAGSSLRRLHIPGSGLSAESLTLLSHFILVDAALQSLNISRNYFDSPSVSVFKYSLQYNLSLVDLNVYHCNLPLSLDVLYRGARPDEWIHSVEAVMRVYKAFRASPQSTLEESAGRGAASLEEVLERWSECMQECRVHHARPANGSKLSYMAMLIHVADACLDASDCCEWLAVARSFVESCCDGQASDSEEAAAVASLETGIGAAHLLSAEYCTATEKTLLYSRGKHSSAVAFVHLVMEVYPAILDKLLKEAMLRNIAAAKASRVLERTSKKTKANGSRKLDLVEN